MDTAENLSFAVNRDVIVLFQSVDEMLGVSVTDYHASKVIDYQVKDCGPSDVTEDTGSVSGREVSIFCKMLDELDVSHTTY